MGLANNPPPIPDPGDSQISHISLTQDVIYRTFPNHLKQRDEVDSRRDVLMRIRKISSLGTRLIRRCHGRNIQ